MSDGSSHTRMEVLIKCGCVNFKKCNLLDNRLLIGIDSGSSMIKVVFLHKDNKAQLFDDSIDFVTLTHGLFNNADFDAAIQWTQERAYVPDDTNFTVHITGVTAKNKRSVIKSILGLETEDVDEMLTIAAGHKIALERIGLDNLLSSNVDVKFEGSIKSDMFDKFAEAMSSKFLSEESFNDDIKPSVFPCLIHVYGSASGFFYFDENGVGEFSSLLLTGGKTFLGLAKCLLDTNDYDEIIRLASIGNRANIDTQVKEILSDDPNSPYGKIPPELPLLGFGKCMDFNRGLEYHAKEDVASSLVAFYSMMIVMECTHLCMVKRIPKVFLTGNIFRSDLFKREIERMKMIFPFVIGLEILDFGYFGALGSMLTSDKDKEIYYKGSHMS